MKKKNVMIDELAMMVQKSFENTATKDQFERLDLRMGRVEKDIKDVKKQLTDIVYRSEFDELKR